METVSVVEQQQTSSLPVLGIYVPMRKELQTLWKTFFPSDKMTRIVKDESVSVYEGELEGLLLAVVSSGARGQQYSQKGVDLIRRRYVNRLVGTVLVGIGGALDDDLKYGDVIVAAAVDNYAENAKSVPSEDGKFQYQFSGEVYRIPNSIANEINLLELENDTANLEWQEKVELAKQKLKKEHVVMVGINPVKYAVGHIATGETVSASLDFKKYLRTKRDRKILAIETEAAGAMFATASADQPPVIVIRGISDYSDENKMKSEFDSSSQSQSQNNNNIDPLAEIHNYDLQHFAMESACEFLRTLLKAGILFPRTPEQLADTYRRKVFAITQECAMKDKIEQRLLAFPNSFPINVNDYIFTLEDKKSSPPSNLSKKSFIAYRPDSMSEEDAKNLYEQILAKSKSNHNNEDVKKKIEFHHKNSKSTKSTKSKRSRSQAFHPNDN